MRIALIHAVRVAIDPVEDAFSRLWPEVTLMNLLDDRLSGDLAEVGMLTPSISNRRCTVSIAGPNAEQVYRMPSTPVANA